MSDRLAEVEVIFAAHSEGGREKTPDLNGGWYRPHFRVRGDAEHLGVQFVAAPGGEVIPGKPIRVSVRFAYEPNVSYEKLGMGSEFEILEGARVVGRGHVVRV